MIAPGSVGLIGAWGSLLWSWMRDGVMKLEELMSDDIIGVSQLYIVLVRVVIFLSSDSCIGIKLINVSYSVRSKVALARWKL
jgi:hypothetical protein